MSWAETANNLRQQIGQKTSNIANIGQSERESRRARNVALIQTLAEMGMDIGKMGFSKSEREATQGFTTSERESGQQFSTRERSLKAAQDQEAENERFQNELQLLSQRVNSARQQGMEDEARRFENEIKMAEINHQNRMKEIQKAAESRDQADKERVPLQVLADEALDAFSISPDGAALRNDNMSWNKKEFTQALFNTFIDYSAYRKPDWVTDEVRWKAALTRAWGNIPSGDGTDETTDATGGAWKKGVQDVGGVVGGALGGAMPAPVGGLQKIINGLVSSLISKNPAKINEALDSIIRNPAQLLPLPQSAADLMTTLQNLINKETRGVEIRKIQDAIENIRKVLGTQEPDLMQEPTPMPEYGMGDRPR